MKNKSVAKLTAKPHSWKLATEYVTLPKRQLLRWLRESELPGVRSVSEGCWPPKDCEQFMRFFCGEDK